ncbi:MAG TPA: hypothetical protein VGK73_14005 [Polyangiaceae bacterium]
MPLTSEEVLELKALLGPGSKVSDEFRTQAQQRLDASEDERLQGWAAAGGTKADSAPVVPGELGVKGIIGQEGKGDAASLDAEAERVAGMLDPRFSLVPQALALQPATGDPVSDDAARQRWQGGDKNAVVVYEPPADVVRKHLLENPALLRALRPDEPPPLEEIASLDAGSSLYRDAANYMWRKTKEAADKSGRAVYRQSELPWLSDDPEMPQSLEVRAGNAGTELHRKGKAFIMGVDDTALLGASRAIHEAVQPESMLDRPTMGVNESVPQKTSDLNAWEAEQNPLSYGGGQLYGATANWGVANKIWNAVQEGGGWLAQAAARTRGGAWLDELAPAWLKGTGAVAGDAVMGGAAAVGTQVGQESVDAAARGELPDLAEASERTRDVGLVGAGLSTLGSGGARLAHHGANSIRRSPRFTGPQGPGAVGRTEPNVEYRFGREPRLKGETKALVDRANAAGDQPGDLIAEEIAPKIRDAAQGNTRAARVESDIERRAYQATPEGSAAQPASHLERMSLEKLRDHHQPQADGSLRPVDNNFREAQQVFNRHIDSVSLEPVQGAVEISAAEAAAFLGPRQRYQLLKKDIDAAAPPAASTEKLDRDAYLKTLKDSRARAEADEEIEASIEDIVGDRTPSPAARERAEQQVLRELVEEKSFTEMHGELGAYLKQRGKDRVYVKPAAYDARRTDTLVAGLKDPDLVEAAKYDRQQFPKGGERGGYELMRRRQDERLAEAEKVEKSVAPGGDAFQPVAGLYQPRPGEKQLVDRVKALADQSGTREQLDKMRTLQETLALKNRASFRGPQGQTRSPFAPQNLMDAAQLRGAFPALKALEGPLGPLGGGNAGRGALLGNPEDAAAQAAGEQSARSRYGALRDQRLRAIAAEKDAKAKDEERRTTEKIQRRR